MVSREYLTPMELEYFTSTGSHRDVAEGDGSLAVVW
jgi:hypothetical protein